MAVGGEHPPCARRLSVRFGSPNWSTGGHNCNFCHCLSGIQWFPGGDDRQLPYRRSYLDNFHIVPRADRCSVTRNHADILSHSRAQRTTTAMPQRDYSCRLRHGTEAAGGSGIHILMAGILAISNIPATHAGAISGPNGPFDTCFEVSVLGSPDGEIPTVVKPFTRFPARHYFATDAACGVSYPPGGLRLHLAVGG